MSDVIEYVNKGGGICGTCLEPAGATHENQGYSSCCNDRIEYDQEALDDLRRARYEDADGDVVEILGSWGQPEGRGKVLGSTVYYGKDATVVLGEDGRERLYIDSEQKIRPVQA